MQAGEVQQLQPNETMVVGRWVFRDGRMFLDAAGCRIEALMERCLTHIATSPDGWEKLFVDQRDGRAWELTYPQGELQGGGPPMLRLVNVEAVLSRYGAPSQITFAGTGSG